jgi:putative alpha-1,2-mannosidase
MYTALGRPELAAKWIRVVSDSLYKTGPDGLSGNDDCGQMSAWFVWSALGMYPMNPVGGDYVFGYPLTDRAAIRLPNGKTLTVRVNRKSGAVPAITAVRFNGRAIPVKTIGHKTLLQGGLLEMDVVR